MHNTMADNTHLTIFCVVDGAPLSQAFPVSIHPSQTIGHLKKLIKIEQSPDFDDITADKLTLWTATMVADCAYGKTELHDPRFSISTIFPYGAVEDNHYVIVQRPPRPSFHAYPLAPGLSQALSIDPPVKSVEPESKRDESTLAATSNNNDNSNTSLFIGWQRVLATGRADRDGFLLSTSRFNGDMAGYTSDVQRFFDSRRDKYGQGLNSVMMPIMENETYDVQGAEWVWFMGLRKVNVNHNEVVGPLQ